MTSSATEMPVGLQATPHPEVFDIRAMPPHKLPLKPGQLEESNIRHYFEKGYLIVPDFFNKEELDACRRDIDVLVDNLAQSLYDNGKITNMHKDKGFLQRLASIEKEFPGANIILIKHGVLTKAFEDLWSNERLLNLIEQILGPELMGHPVWNLRTKTPKNEATTVPWHQDAGYLHSESYGVLQPTAWIPLVDANEENGCMEVISGGHLTGNVARHTCCWGDTWYIVLDEKDMEESLNVDVNRDKVLCPIPYGGMLLINNMIPHHSLNNTSGAIRWSLDLRWQRPDKPIGMYGLKSGVMLRSQKNPIDKIDWDSFNSVDRNEEQRKYCEEEVKDDDFDTTITGPWMTKWEMTHTNRHTEKLINQKNVIMKKA